MNLFKKVEGIKEEQDTLGGSKFGVWDTGVYDVILDSVYLDESMGGAYSMNFVFKTADGKELKTTEYVTSGKSKGQLNYYIDKNGEKRYLPGYIIANAIAFATTGKELPDLTPEEKIVEVYNYDLKKNVHTKKLVYMDMIGKPLKLGVIKVKEFKRVKDNTTGEYVDIDEIKEYNEVAKVFDKDGFTMIEKKSGLTEPEFINKWSEKYTSEYVRDRTKNKTPGSVGTGGQTKPAGTPSLFGGNK